MLVPSSPGRQGNLTRAELLYAAPSPISANVSHGASPPGSWAGRSVPKPSRRTILGGVLSLVPSMAFADLIDDYQNSVSKRSYVSFLARHSEGGWSKPGHSFVAVGTELDNGLKVYEKIFGYYPKNETALEEVKATIGTVAGEFKHKLSDIVWSVELFVPTYEKGHTAALDVMNKWSANDPRYQLFANGGKNCSVFAAEVAQALGLKVPDGPGRKLPVQFITELRNMNPRASL